MDKIVILTGAGISAESGLGTYRGPGGLWNDKRIAALATPEGFANDPETFAEFHNTRRLKHLEAQPNAAHEAIARLEAEYPGELILVTQNVDRLHERGGAQAVLHMHGVSDDMKCNVCGVKYPQPFEVPWDVAKRCDDCGGRLRPDTVWFGEMPYHMDEIQEHLATCDLFAAIGTSGNVYPAAGFVRIARHVGARTIEINLEASEVTSDFDDVIRGPASEVVPMWVDGILANVGL
ncbi:NAD-dependent deacetylase [Oceanicola sp. 22II-s10i]|uniref:NAD-dependent deacylase n=1 Tax=Oceanicola sp. 22II-s10i TaxID=1317116 RepID=UPI000B5227D3|nr:NAD-dependent deacylase [Oceanicola sp. 22II-s10i]OWU85035.1 NAD-dependent deacetylase [Oceanicola sp. 22II-s10i]